jgi:nitronate monooxygenase
LTENDVNALQSLFGTEFPIIQAPMAGVQDHRLAAAVSNAGGLGSLPCAMLTVEGIHKELQALKAKTTRPFNVNFFCHIPPEPSPDREAAWREVLAPYYREFDIDPATIPTGPGRAPFSEEAADVLSAFKPAVVSFHFGLPEPALLQRVRMMGAKILSSATTVDEARWLESQGVDAIVAQGLEAGGHRGMFQSDDLTTQAGTFSLVPQIVQAVRVPVIAAGGIANRQGIAAALALGAAGVQLGTTYLLSREATITSPHRAALKSESVRHTALTNLFTGRPSRSIVNRIIREIGPINAGVPKFPLATSAIAPLRAKAEARGSGDFSPLWAGQNTTGCRELPAAEITRQLAE